MLGRKKVNPTQKRPKAPGNAQISRFGNFGALGLIFSQNMRNQKVHWRCNNFGLKKGQSHPKTPKNAQISRFGNFMRNQKVN